jgi:pyridoxal 5'-phosphate synthase pdxT subunit
VPVWIPGGRVAGAPGPAELDPAASDAPTIGVLALQGDVLAHLRALRAVGAVPVRVRTLTDLAQVDGLIVPGGESTTIARLLDLTGMLAPLAAAVRDGLPVLGTCAGLILLSDRLTDDDPPPRRIGGLDITTRRNAFGRQVASFETDLVVGGLTGGPVHAVFIRAPWVEEVGDGVEVLASVEDRPVVVSSGPLLATAFHPEVAGETRIHAAFLARVRDARGAARRAAAGPGVAVAR